MYDSLIESSRYAEKIRHLLENPSLGVHAIHKEGIRSCCWGTIAYLLDANQKVRDLWKSAGHNLEDFRDASGDFVCIPDDSRPGYMGREPMELFLSTLKRGEKSIDNVICFYWENGNDIDFPVFGLHHSGIFLGAHEGQEIMFHQKGSGFPFELVSLDDWKKSLHKDSRESLEERFYHI